MLRQIKGASSSKVEAVTEIYPTPSLLRKAYENLAKLRRLEVEGPTLLASLRTGGGAACGGTGKVNSCKSSNNQEREGVGAATAGGKALGPAFSAAVFDAVWGFSWEGEDSQEGDSLSQA